MTLSGVGILCATLAWSAALFAAEELPLHQRIDLAIQRQHAGSLAGPASDAEFVRRVWLDLAGVIPSGDQVRRFLADRDPSKRAKLIEAILEGPDYPRRMQEFCTVMWLDRRESFEISVDEWKSFLEDSFRANKPWDQLVRELLAADGIDEKTAPLVKFFLDRKSQNLLTLDISRMFLGRNLRCAQCHDHPSIEDYTQLEYQGLLAYLRQGKMFLKRSEAKYYFTDEIAPAKLSFKSVMTGEEGSTGPRLLFRSEVPVPQFAGDDFWVRPPNPDEGDPGLPKFQPRKLLAEHLPTAEDEAFCRNTANRLWAMMMGRGLVHPLDLHHGGNPPSHPELLAMLAADLRAMKFDTKAFLRELALSETYQRSSLLPPGAGDEALRAFAAYNANPLSPEQLAHSLLRAIGNPSPDMLETASLPLSEASEPLGTAFSQGQEANEADPDASGEEEDLQIAVEKTQESIRLLFGKAPAGPEDEFAPTPDQAMFLSHDEHLLRLLAPHGRNLTARLELARWLMPSDSAPAQSAPSKGGIGPSNLADELYFTVLCRPPTVEEKTEVVAYLESQSARATEGLQDLVWALLTSVEFRLNH